MTQNPQTRLAEAITQVIADWKLSGQIEPEEISRRILERAAFWSTTLADGESVALIRLYAPVVQRQEVFLGNVLLNDFLFKALPYAVDRAELGQMRLLLNDLENAYFLWQGNADVEALRDAYQAEILDTLPDLYFGEEDTPRGIHGDVRGMLTFYKCNIEPFPTFIVPQAYLGRLLEVVGEWLREIVDEDGSTALAKAAHISTEIAKSWRIKVILSLLSYFYHQDGTEMQGFHSFISQSIADGRMPGNHIKAAFGFGDKESFDKDKFDKRRNSGDVNYQALARAVKALLKHVKQTIAEEEAINASPRLGTEKMLILKPKDLAQKLLGRVQLGYGLGFTQKLNHRVEGIACRFCGQDLATIENKNILGGSGANNRFNQSLKIKKLDERLCIHCALSSYLVTKRLGMRFESKYPIPKLYNIIFHYGQHDNWEIKAIQRQIDYTLEYARSDKNTTDLLADLKEIRVQAALGHGIDLPGIVDIDWENWLPPAREVIAQMQQDVQAEVIPLGSGPYRLLVFILPQLRPGSKEGLDFVQKRFSHSRLAIFTLLGLLRNLCGCDGPYYFQSLPTLAPGHFKANTFYVNGQAEQADEALRRYGAITNFARQVVKYRRGHSILADWILLAEKLEQDPLGTFSDVLRDSPIRGGDDLGKAGYKRLSNQFVPGMAVVDATEYLKLFEQLQNLQTNIQS